MQLAVRIADEVVTVIQVLASRVTAEGMPDFARAAKKPLDEGACHVVIDLKRVEFLDSSGLGQIVATSKMVKERAGGELVIAGAMNSVRDLLRLTRLDKVLHVFADVESALEYLRGRSAQAGAGTQ
jgi:anti-sigma B factor antagonist